MGRRLSTPSGAHDSIDIFLWNRLGLAQERCPVVYFRQFVELDRGKGRLFDPCPRRGDTVAAHEAGGLLAHDPGELRTELFVGNSNAARIAGQPFHQ